MAISFIPAGELKQKYIVSGHFYSLNTDETKSRSVLEIINRDTYKESEVDAVFVMMNPGSSRPVSEADNIIKSNHISEMKWRLAPAHPDTTQYQVMRVMHYSGWNYVRVINLSDLHDTKSDSFAQRYLQLENTEGCTAHSIFSPQRSKELQQHLSRKYGGSVVCAWGVSDKLDPLVDRARIALSTEAGITGLEKSEQPWKYYHPLPPNQKQQEKWVADMLDKLHG